MPGRDKLSNLISVSITQSPTNKSYSLYLPTRPDFFNFLCERWCEEEQLGGGFKDETEGVLVTTGIVADVAALESTQQEADTRVILHSIYSVQNEDVERIITHANDTDTVVRAYMCVLRFNVADRFVGTGFAPHETAICLPIHAIAAARRPASSLALPFIHSLSGIYTTS